MREDGGIYMSKKGQFLFNTVSEFLSGKINRSEAAQLMQVTERSITRMARRVEKKGLFAGVHGNRGRVPWNKKDEEQKSSVMQLVERSYFDFNMTHCLEKLKEEHGIKVGYETLRRWCHEKTLVKRAKKRKPKARYKSQATTTVV